MGIEWSRQGRGVKGTWTGREADTERCVKGTRTGRVKGFSTVNCAQEIDVCAQPYPGLTARDTNTHGPKILYHTLSVCCALSNGWAQVGGTHSRPHNEIVQSRAAVRVIILWGREQLSGSQCYGVVSSCLGHNAMGSWVAVWVTMLWDREQIQRSQCYGVVSSCLGHNAIGSWAGVRVTMLRGREQLYGTHST